MLYEVITLPVCKLSLATGFSSVRWGVCWRGNSNPKSKRTLRWLVFGSSTYDLVCLRRLNPRRLNFIFDLGLELDGQGSGNGILERSRRPSNQAAEVMAFIKKGTLGGTRRNNFV